VCATSGWNCTPQNFLATDSTAAKAQLGLVPSLDAIAVAHPHG
jgi:hypothetical protein